jgi:hypothetical protein
VRNMRMFSLRSRQYGDAETATLEKDLFLNFVVVILLLVGQQYVVARAKTAGHRKTVEGTIRCGRASSHTYLPYGGYPFRICTRSTRSRGKNSGS